MKLATLRNTDSRDGNLIVVSRDGQQAVLVPEVAMTMQDAIDSWEKCQAQLEVIYSRLNHGQCANAFPLREEDLTSPLPRAYQWVDGSAFLHHVKLVRMARKADMPPKLYEVPLMYQGGSDDFLDPRGNIPQVDFDHGTDFEGEVAVVTNQVPMGVSAAAAHKHVILLCLVNDVSLRRLIPEELATGFGFFQSKPSSAFSPFFVTPDELGDAWKDGRVHLPLDVEYNGAFFGCANAGEMHFNFGQLIAHAARTRNLGPGTIVGSGTVSNDDPSVGSSCLVEKRMLEAINKGEMTTPFMKVGDTVKISMSRNGQNIFGTIFQKVVPA
jgi:fumarylacetoacetate (FAA) hydrolase